MWTQREVATTGFVCVIFYDVWIFLDLLQQGLASRLEGHVCKTSDMLVRHSLVS